MITKDNQGKPVETTGNHQKPPERLNGAIVQIYTTSIEEYIHITHIVLYTSEKKNFRGNLANFRKSKEFIIFHIHYRPGSKKSKFDMTLIRHSPFKDKMI